MLIKMGRHGPQRFHNNLKIKKSHSSVTLSFHLLSTILARFTWHYFRDFMSERNRRNNMNQDILVTFIQFLSDLLVWLQ